MNFLLPSYIKYKKEYQRIVEETIFHQFKLKKKKSRKQDDSLYLLPTTKADI